MTFDFPLLFRLLWKAFFRSRGTPAPLTWRRLGILLVQMVVYAINELANWTGFLLDEIFFRDYRKIEIRDPVFIVGPPRSGTTLLHRVLAKDESHFTSLRMWEIALAPSIVQKKLWLAVAAFDRRCGGRMQRWLRLWEERRYVQFARMHHVGLLEAEEDEPLMLHIFSSVFLSFVFPFWEDLRSLIRFDLELPAAQRARIMAFYRCCVQRHLYVFGPRKRFLSKNPTFSTRIRSLRETFPSARIVCTVRNPLEVVPSAMSILSYIARRYYTPPNGFPQRDHILDMLLDQYLYPAQAMADCPVREHAHVMYDALSADPARAVRELYARFGFPVEACYEHILADETRRAREYRSTHAYSLEQFGLTREEVLTRFSEVLERFGFDAGGETTRGAPHSC